MAFDLTKPSMTDVTVSASFGFIRENYRAIVQADAGVFTKSSGDYDMQMSTTSTTGLARLFLIAGNGTTSSRNVYSMYRASETTVQDWIAGMFGTKDYVIRNNTVARNDLSILTTGEAILATRFGIGGGTPVDRLEVGAGGTGGTQEGMRLNSGSGSGGAARFFYQRNSVTKAIIGLPGAAGVIIAGSAADDLAISSTQTILFSADNGTTKHASLSNVGAWTFSGVAANPTEQLYTGTTTAFHRSRWTNTTGDLICGVENSAGNAMLAANSIAYAGVLSVVANKPLLFGTNNALRLQLDNLGNIVPGTAALATTATDGFIYCQTCAGTPTGTPTAFTGRVAMVYDTTNNKLYIYNGAWKSVTLA